MNVFTSFLSENIIEKEKINITKFDRHQKYLFRLEVFSIQEYSGLVRGIGYCDYECILTHLYWDFSASKYVFFKYVQACIMPY